MVGTYGSRHRPRFIMAVSAQDQARLRKLVRLTGGLTQSDVVRLALRELENRLEGAERV